MHQSYVRLAVVHICFVPTSLYIYIIHLSHAAATDVFKWAVGNDFMPLKINQ